MIAIPFGSEELVQVPTLTETSLKANLSLMNCNEASLFRYGFVHKINIKTTLPSNPFIFKILPLVTLKSFSFIP